MSLVHFCSYSQYREATARHTGDINTFSCGGCGKFRSIVGRKMIAKVGRTRKYHCAECVKHTKKIED